MTTYDISAEIEATGVATLPETEAALRRLVEQTQTEPGCLRFEIRQDRDEPTRFTLWESWANEAALAAHFDYPHTKSVIDAGITRVLTIRRLGAIGAQTLAKV